MGKAEKRIILYEKLKGSPTSASFADLCKLAEMVDFVFDRQNGSHKIYVHSSYSSIMNFQDVNGKAKPYQVRQLLSFIDENNLVRKD